MSHPRPGLFLCGLAILAVSTRAETGSPAWLYNLNLTASGSETQVDNLSRTSHKPTRKDATTYDFSLGSSQALAPHEAPALANTLQRRPALNPFHRFMLGRHHGFGVDAWGTVVGFGHAMNGALGNGLNRPDLKLGPTRLGLRSLPLAAAGHHTLGLL